MSLETINLEALAKHINRQKRKRDLTYADILDIIHQRMFSKQYEKHGRFKYVKSRKPLVGDRAVYQESVKCYNLLVSLGVIEAAK